MTALEFLSEQRDVRVISIGVVQDVCWAIIRFNNDGTEEQSAFLMERFCRARAVFNLSARDELGAQQNPLFFWNHARACTPERK